MGPLYGRECDLIEAGLNEAAATALGDEKNFKTNEAGRAAPPRTIARGFVLWRLSDAGHRALGFSCIAGIRNPAQSENSRQRDSTADLPSIADICGDCRHGR